MSSQSSARSPEKQAADGGGRYSSPGINCGHLDEVYQVKESGEGGGRDKLTKIHTKSH